MRTLTNLLYRLTLSSALMIIGFGCNSGSTATVSEPDSDSSAANSYQAQLRAAAAAREKDPAWKPAYAQIAAIQVRENSKGGRLNSFCVNTNGSILACCGGSAEKGENKILVFSPNGKLAKTMPLPVSPGAVCVDKNGMIFVGGGGRILKLNQEGEVLASGASPVAKALVSIGPDIEKMFKEQGDSVAQRTNYLKMLEGRKGNITGIAVTKNDVFFACPAPDDFTYRVYRMDHNLANATLVVEKLRGCCGQMDIQALDDKLWIPHNARHRVECRDREGKEISKFGKAGRVKPDQFGGCCEPKNLRFTPAGEILAAESGPPTCIKKFSQDGKFLGVVGVVNSDGSCVRVTVDVSPDGKQFYLLDTTQNAIRVFGEKS